MANKYTHPYRIEQGKIRFPLNAVFEGNLEILGTQTLTGAIALNGAVTIGDAVGDAITVKGTLNCDEAVTLDKTLGVTGVTTLTGALVANGDVTLGNAAADTVTVTGQIAGSLEFTGAAQHSVIGEADQVLAVKAAGTGHLYLGTAGDENAIEIADDTGDVTVAQALYVSDDLVVSGNVVHAGSSGAAMTLKTKTATLDLSAAHSTSG